MESTTALSRVTPLTAHMGSSSDPNAGSNGSSTKGLHLGREKVKWKEEVWHRIDRAVTHEFWRTSIAAKILPHHRVDPHATSVQQDQILQTINGSIFNLQTALNPYTGQPANLLPNIDEGTTTKLVEMWVEFSLTPQQLEQENEFKEHHPDDHEHEEHAAQHVEEHSAAEHGDGHDEQGMGHRRRKGHKHHRFSTAVTLAVRAANILSQAMDSVIFQGMVATGDGTAATPVGPFFSSGLVANRGFPSDYGLLGLSPKSSSTPVFKSSQILTVQQITPNPLPTSQSSSQYLTIPGPPPGGSFTVAASNTFPSVNVNWNLSGGQASNSGSALVSSILTAFNSSGGANFNANSGGFTVTPLADFNSITGTGTVQLGFGSNAPSGWLTVTAGAANSSFGIVSEVPSRYSENTVAAVAAAYSTLQAAGHYGPYAAVLHYVPFADTYAPLANTLILPADRIKPLMNDGYYGTGTIPGQVTPLYPAASTPFMSSRNATNPNAQAMGLVISTGANTMDLVIGQHPITAFSQIDQYGNHLFRLLSRHALRFKDTSAAIRLEFL